MKKVISILVLVLIFWFLGKNISANWEQIRSFNWNLNIADIFLILISFSGIYLINILSWHFLLKSLGINLSFKKNFRIWLLANATRLLPGGIWQYPSKLILTENEGVKRNIALTAVIMETLFTLSLGAVTIFATLPFWAIPGRFSYLNNFLWIFLATPFLTIFLLHPKVIKILVSCFAKIRKRKVEFKGIRFSKKDLTLSLVLFLAKFLVFGLAFFVLVDLIYPIEVSFFPILLGALSLSWVVGFLAVFAPAGLGVTELSLSVMLSLYFSIGVASFIAVLFRAVLLLTEGIFLLLALSIKKR